MPPIVLPTGPQHATAPHFPSFPSYHMTSAYAPPSHYAPSPSPYAPPPSPYAAPAFGPVQLLAYHEAELERHRQAVELLRATLGGVPTPAPLAPPKKRKRMGCPKGVTPAGFVKKMRVTTPLLAEVLDHAKDQPIPRQKVAHGVIAYIKRHSLQRSENRKYLDFSGDSEAARNMRELFGVDDSLTFFSLQQLLKQHMEDFGAVEEEPKPEDPAEEEEEATEEEVEAA